MSPLVLLGSVAVCVFGSCVAACPIRADMSTGVALTFSDDLVEIYRAGDNGDITVEGRDGETITHRLDLLLGVYIGRYVAVEDGEDISAAATTYTYPQGPDAPTIPVVGESWIGAVTLTEGGEDRVEMQTHDVDVPQELTIGECDYVVLPVTIVYGEDAVYTEIVNYLPELGFGYLAAYANQGREMNEQVVTLIEVMP